MQRRRPLMTIGPVSSCLRHLATAVVAGGVWAAAAFGQDAAAPPGGGSSVVVSGRPLYVEFALVLVLIGAVLFAVCRSSRRN